MITVRIAGITDINGKTREDGRYPQRIGSTVRIEELYLGAGYPLLLEYISDNQGNPKEGVLRCSAISTCEHIEQDHLWIITTRNSVYYLEEAQP